MLTDIGLSNVTNTRLSISELSHSSRSNARLAPGSSRRGSPSIERLPFLGRDWESQVAHSAASNDAKQRARSRSRHSGARRKRLIVSSFTRSGRSRKSGFQRWFSAPSSRKRGRRLGHKSESTGHFFPRSLARRRMPRSTLDFDAEMAGRNGLVSSSWRSCCSSTAARGGSSLL